LARWRPSWSGTRTCRPWPCWSRRRRPPTPCSARPGVSRPMPTLRELQAHVRAAMLDGDEGAAAAAVHDDDLGAAARVAVYRHHVLTSLTVTLESTYPVVARLVDPRFFRYAADRYIREQPPTGPCLFEYGGGLAEFLVGLSPRHPPPLVPHAA